MPDPSTTLGSTSLTAGRTGNFSVMEMSLRDVEPVKSFIDDMIDVRNGRKLAGDGTTVEAMDAAFRRLYHGFGRQTPQTSRMARMGRHDPRVQGLKESRGWRVGSDRVPKLSECIEWPAVGIVIPVYNAPALLRKCLVSLMRTDYPGEVYHLFVDNASTDKETLQILDNVSSTPIRFDEPVGFAEAVNAGIRAIREHCPEVEYVVLFNQDCQVVDEDWLKYLINWMEHRPKCAVAGAKLVYPDGAYASYERLQHAGLEIPKGSCGRHRYLHGDPDAPEVNYYEKMQSVTGAVYAIRASVLDEVGYLDERYKLGCEDTEYSLRVAQYGHEVWYVPDSVVVHEDNAVKKANSRDRERIRNWQRASDHLFRTEYGRFVDRCDGGQVAFVLPDWNPVAGGCRVVGALANCFINAGMETAVYVQNQQAGREDPDFPQLFEIKPLSKLERADILVATRYDTVLNTKHIMADRKFYLVQADERPMAKYCGGTEADVIRSYQQIEYEIITIGEHLREMLAGYGRTCGVLDVGLYRDLYPYVECGEPNKPFRILMYMTSADYKGGEDLPGIAHAIREHLGDRVKICSFHRDFGQPGWADDHFRPKSTSEVGEVYCWHDCYIYASHSDGFAMTPVEAMACGTPVILTDFPGKDQYALDGRNCLVVPFRNFHAIAEAVERLIENPGLWRGLSAMGAQTAKRLDWSVVGRQWLRAILEAPSYV